MMEFKPKYEEAIKVVQDTRPYPVDQLGNRIVKVRRKANHLTLKKKKRK